MKPLKTVGKLKHFKKHLKKRIKAFSLPKNFFCIVCYVLTAGVLLWGFHKRLNLALSATPGGDYSTHLRAISDLFAGKSPYAWTLETYANLENDPTNKGYAYFPGILYVNGFLYLISLILQLGFGLTAPWLSPAFVLHLPGILAHLGVGVFLANYFLQRKKAYLPGLFAVSFWVFNFYFVLKGSLAGFDAVPVLFLLFALDRLEKDDVLAGVFFALSVLFKTFAVITFPLFLLRSKKAWKFLAAGFLVALTFSLPFMRSWQDFWIYVQGALLVHGDRFIQGRPFLQYIAWYGQIEFFRIIPFGFYSLSSIFSGWVLIFFNKILMKIKELQKLSLEGKYAISALPFLSFYALTPVLNRTYLLWGIPFFLLGSYEIFGVSKKRWKKALYYALNISYWIFCYWYLAQWKDGFHIWHPIK